MARVECDIEESLIEVEGKAVDGIVVTCGRCGHEVEIPGFDTPENRLKARQLLHATCPSNEDNRYRFPETVIGRDKINMQNDPEA